MCAALQEITVPDFEKAEAKARNQEKLDTAKNMKNDNMPPAKIAKYTGLTLAQIKKL